MSSEVRVSGPIFDGRAERAAEKGLKAARRRLAEEAARLTREAFSAAIRDNRGRFLASITTTDHSTVYSTPSGRHVYSLPVVVGDPANETAVTTDLATYGPWLEGVGSRNSTTRFRGYHGFRRAAQQLDGRARQVADEQLAPYVEEMNR